MGKTPEGTQKFAEWWNTDGLKMANMDATLMNELDRLAADYNISANECLRQLMALRAEREGAEAVRIMVETATELWSNFKPGARTGAYWAMRRAQREAASLGI